MHTTMQVWGLAAGASTRGYAHALTGRLQGTRKQRCSVLRTLPPCTLQQGAGGGGWGAYRGERAHAIQQFQAATVQPQLLQLGRAAQPAACGRGGGRSGCRGGRAAARRRRQRSPTRRPCRSCFWTSTALVLALGSWSVHAHAWFGATHTVQGMRGGRLAGLRHLPGDLQPQRRAPRTAPCSRLAPLPRPTRKRRPPAPPATASPSQRMVSARSVGSRGSTVATTSSQRGCSCPPCSHVACCKEGAAGVTGSDVRHAEAMKAQHGPSG